MDFTIKNDHSTKVDFAFKLRPSVTSNLVYPYLHSIYIVSHYGARIHTESNVHITSLYVVRPLTML